MRKKLKLVHTEQYYRSRLKTLSVNNEVYDVVVEERGNSFVLYRNSGPLKRWERITDITMHMSSYKAIISFEGQEILMEIKMRTHALWSCLLLYLAIGGFSIYNMLQGDPAWLLSCLMLTMAILFHQLERRSFKRFMPVFLNNLQ